MSQKIEQEQLHSFRDVFVSFSKYRSTDNLNDLSDNFVSSILNILGFGYNKFSSNKKQNASFTYLYDGYDMLNKVSCIYVVSPLHSIDSTTKGNFPAFELIHLLKKEKLEWGILTNGVTWRLYSILNSQPFENFFEIDFTVTDDSDFQAFYNLFSVQLFIPDEHQKTPLEKYIEESEKEAKTIEEHIKKNIDDILETISFGFLTHSGKINSPLSVNDKQEYFNNSVYLLFRLLFIFYAESRKLLPLDNNNYFEVSLEKMLETSKRWLVDDVFEDPDGTDLWIKFRDLSIYIDQGNSSLNIPEYDGGLFDVSLHHFLSNPDNQLTNMYFAKILYKLGYYSKGRQTVKIEYRDLSVRSLGSLYEGILEYQLFIASEDLVLRDKKFILKSNAGIVKRNEREIPQGHVYFSQDANERHDTGSYYTPEDVVDYMVTNSVRIGLESRWIEFLPTIKKYEKELKIAINESACNRLLKRFDDELLTFVRSRILTYKVIDPAMGSGHFLVNTLNCITNFIIEVLSSKLIFVDTPIKHEAEVTEIDWPLFEFYSDLSLDPLYWRRKVAENCLFGIDINYLATELAKLSIWIASAAAGKPLAFLDHHLKRGDSVMGIRISDLISYPVKKDVITDSNPKVFDKLNIDKIEKLKSDYQAIFDLASDDIDEVTSKKETYSQIKNDIFLSHLNDLATLWLMISFEVNKPKNKTLFDTENCLPDETSYYDYLEKAQTINNEAEWQDLLGLKLYNEIKIFSTNKKVFHWELEFPEIINNGFDAALGNPPYVDVFSESYIGINLKKILGSRNLYSYIVSNSLLFTKTYGHISFILPMSLIFSERMKPLRNELSNHTCCLFNIDSAARPGTLFENVIIQISILNCIKDGKHKVYTTDYTRFNNPNRKVLFKNSSYILNPFISDDEFPKIGNQLEISILNKIKHKTDKTIKNYISDNSENNLYYKNAGVNYYTIAYIEPPYIKGDKGEYVGSTTSVISFLPFINVEYVASIIYSSLFYWYWIIYGDCFHLSKNEIFSLPIDILELQENFSFINQWAIINENLINTSKIVTYKRKHGVNTYREFKPRYSKHIFDIIDKELAKYYGLDKEELDFIINYDLKFRTDAKCQENN